MLRLTGNPSASIAASAGRASLALGSAITPARNLLVPLQRRVSVCPYGPLTYCALSQRVRPFFGRLASGISLRPMAAWVSYPKGIWQCAEFGRGGCQVVSFSGQECVALATFIGSYRRRRWSLSFTAGGNTYPEAQNAAMARPEPRPVRTGDRPDGAVVIPTESPANHRCRSQPGRKSSCPDRPSE